MRLASSIVLFDPRAAPRRLNRPIVAVLAFILSATGVAAAERQDPVRIAVRPPPELGEPLAGSIFVFRHGWQTGGDEEAQRFPVTGPGSYEVPPPSDPVSWAYFDLPGFWAPPIELSSANRAAETQLVVGGALVGRLLTTGDDAEPSAVHVRFSSAARDGSAKALTGETVCPAAEGRFHCWLPLGTLDMALAPQGYAPEYRWALKIDRERPVDAGPVQLRPAGVVAGTVLAADGSRLDRLPEAPVVKLLPGGTWLSRAPLGRQPSRPSREISPARLDAMFPFAAPEADGSFSIKGVRPGDYTISAIAGSYRSPSRATSVLPGRVTQLEAALLLYEPATVEVLITPAADPLGRPWAVALEGPSGIIEGEASYAGWWKAEDLKPGEHRLIIGRSLRSGDGEAMVVRDVAVEAGMPPITIELEDQWVTGQLTLGGSPLEASVRFTHASATARLRFPTDEEGLYLATLPKTGHWQVSVERAPDVEVEVDRLELAAAALPGTVHRLDIDLPHTMLDGRVVREDDEPAVAAYVRVHHLDGETGRRRNTATARSDDGGRFRLQGLEPGAISVLATTLDGEEGSETGVELREDERTEVMVQLRKRRKLRGSVISQAGPVPGARIYALPRGAGSDVPASLSIRQGHSDAEGAFEIELPREATSVTMLVGTKAFGKKYFDILLGTPEPVVLALDGRGGTLALDFEGRAGEEYVASGTLIVRGDMTLPLIFFEPEPDTFSSTRLLVDGFPPGTYDVCFRGHEPALTTCRSATIFDGSYLEVTP